MTVNANVFWDKVNAATMRDLLSEDVFLNARLWRFLEEALKRGEVLDTSVSMGDPEEYRFALLHDAVGETGYEQDALGSDCA